SSIGRLGRLVGGARLRVGLATAAAIFVLSAGTAGQSGGGRPDAGQATGSIAGRVVRADGPPQPDADVVPARRDSRGALEPLRWRARSAFDGRYRIDDVPAGQYLVLVRGVGADAEMPGRPRPTLFPGVPVSEPGVPVEVRTGIPTEGIDVWL